MRGEGSRPERTDSKGKEGEEGVKKDRSERREITTVKSFGINTFGSFFPSPRLAGERILTPSLSSFSNSPPHAYMPACAYTREGGVKGKNESSSAHPRLEEVR